MQQVNLPTKPQKVIIMRSGMTHWVDADRVDILEQILAEGRGHRFIKIDTKMINTAEIGDGIFTPDQYDEYVNIKQGKWQCRYRNWHERKGECHCAREIFKKATETTRRSEYDRKSRTLEEDKSIKKTLSEVRKDLEKKGIFKKSE